MFGEIRNNEGEKIDYQFHAARTSVECDRIVVIGHGVTANLDRPFIKALAEGLADAGYHALRFSFSGNGNSEGNFAESTITKEVADLGAVLETVAKSGYRICYAGHSMGAAVGMIRAGLDPNIKWLISLAGMVETRRFADVEFGEETSGFMWGEEACPLSSAFLNDLRQIESVLPKAEAIQVPFLIIHGTEDDLVPIEEARALAKSGAGVPGELHEIKSNHTFANEATPLMVSLVKDWLARYF